MRIPGGSGSTSSSERGDRCPQFTAERGRFFVRVLDEGLQHSQIDELRDRAFAYADSAQVPLPDAVRARLGAAWTLLLQRWDPLQTPSAANMLRTLRAEQPESSTAPAPLGLALDRLAEVFEATSVLDDSLRDAVAFATTAQSWWQQTDEQDAADLRELARVVAQRRSLNQSVGETVVALDRLREQIDGHFPHVPRDAVRGVLSHLARGWHTESSLLLSGGFMPTPGVAQAPILLALEQFEQAMSRVPHGAALAGAARALMSACREPGVGALFAELATHEREYAARLSSLQSADTLGHQLRESLRRFRQARVEAGAADVSSRVRAIFERMFETLPHNIAREDMNQALQLVRGRWYVLACHHQWRLSMPSVSQFSGLSDVVGELLEEGQPPHIEEALSHFYDEMLAPQNDCAVEAIRNALHQLRLVLLEQMQLINESVAPGPGAGPQTAVQSNAAAGESNAMPLLRALMDASERPAPARLAELLAHEASHHAAYRGEIATLQAPLTQWAAAQQAAIIEQLDGFFVLGSNAPRDAVLSAIGQAVALVRALFDYAGDGAIWRVQTAVAQQMMAQDAALPSELSQALYVWQHTEVDARVREATETAQQAVRWLLGGLEDSAWGLLQQYVMEP